MAESPALFDAIREQANRERDRVLSSAREEAGRILSEARDNCARLHRKTIEEERAALRRQTETVRMRAEDEARREAFSLQHAVADEVLQTVYGAIDRLASSPAFEEVLKQLLREAVSDASPDAVVHVPRRHEEGCRRVLDELGLAGATIEASDSLQDGVVVEDRDRTFRITNTLSHRFRKTMPRARKLCLARVFGRDAIPEDPDASSTEGIE